MKSYIARLYQCRYSFALDSGPTFFWTINFLFSVAWISLSFNVSDRSVWLLENVLVFLLVPVACVTFRRRLISNASYFLIFLFLLLHIVGAHYTYSRVPYREWFESLAFFRFQRNQYDRLVHFSFGMLLFLPLTELFKSKTTLRGQLLLCFTAFFLITCSSMYELIEWAAAITFGGNVGPEYVGTQGDLWDAQKDQALALLGILVALTIVSLKSVRRDT